MQSIPSYVLPSVLEETTEKFFFNKPDVVYVDTDPSIKPSSCTSFLGLAASLRSFGPLVIKGVVGPGAYQEEPIKAPITFGGQDVYCWKANQQQNSTASSSYAVVLGTFKTSKISHILFTEAEDLTEEVNSLVRAYQPLKDDSRIYSMSYESFMASKELNIHFPCLYGNWLFSTTPFDEMLDEGAGEEACKQVGQSIFNHYKAIAGQDSNAGLWALKRMLNAVSVMTEEGKIRKLFLSHAWQSVGDNNCRWTKENV